MPRNLRYWSAAIGTPKDSPLSEASEVQAVQGSEALGELLHCTVVLQPPDSPDLSALVAATLVHEPAQPPEVFGTHGAGAVYVFSKARSLVWTAPDDARNNSDHIAGHVVTR